MDHTSRFPVEILTKVFRDCQVLEPINPPRKAKDSPALTRGDLLGWSKIAGVSKRWRNAALGCGRLWANDLSAILSERSRFLKLSGGCQPSFRYDTRTNALRMRPSLPARSVTQFVKTAAEISVRMVDEQTKDFTHVVETMCAHDLPDLRVLSLAILPNYLKYDSNGSSLRAPNLRSVLLHGVYLPFQTPNLVSLCLSLFGVGVPIQIVLNSLSVLPLLENLSLQNIATCHDAAAIERASLSFDRMQELSICNKYVSGTPLLSAFKVPPTCSCVVELDTYFSPNKEESFLRAWSIILQNQSDKDMFRSAAVVCHTRIDTVGLILDTDPAWPRVIHRPLRPKFAVYITSCVPWLQVGRLIGRITDPISGPWLSVENLMLCARSRKGDDAPPMAWSDLFGQFPRIRTLRLNGNGMYARHLINHIDRCRILRMSRPLPLLETIVDDVPRKVVTLSPPGEVRKQIRTYMQNTGEEIIRSDDKYESDKIDEAVFPECFRCWQVDR